MCGKRRSLFVVIEYTLDGEVGYKSARLCYDGCGTEIAFCIPEGAALREIRIFDMHEPGECIKVTAAPVPG